MTYEQEIVQEISFKFKPKKMAALPSITKKQQEVIKYGGTDFYTNEKLRQKFIMSLMKHTPSKAHNTIIKLVEKKIIVPAFLTSSTMAHYKKTQIDRDVDGPFDGVYGFYAIKEKRIFILIDAGYKVLGWVPDEHLAGVTLHECMHMAAKKNSKRFLQINIKPLHDYYTEFLDQVFNTGRKVNREGLIKWLTYIYGFEQQRSKGLDGKDYRSRVNAAIKGHSKLSDKEIETRLIYVTNYAFGTYGEHGSKLFGVIRKYREIYFALKSSYQRAFRFNAKTTPYQELFTLSEVICMLASMELGKNRYVSDSLDILL